MSRRLRSVGKQVSRIYCRTLSGKAKVLIQKNGLDQARVLLEEVIALRERNNDPAVERDTGYKPYMDYLQSLNGRPPAFGTRNN
jgi:hypothetical protein